MTTMWLLLGCPPQPNDAVPTETERIESSRVQPAGRKVKEPATSGPS